MSGKRGRQAKPIALTTASDPEAPRYPTVTEALRACLPLLAEAILSDVINPLPQSKTADKTETEGADRPITTLGE